MHCFKRMLVWFGLVVVGASGVSGQTLESPYRFVDTGQYIGIFAGYVSTSRGRLELGPESAPTAGARWAMRVSGPFSIGADVGFLSSSRIVRDTVLATPVTEDSLYREVGEADMNLLSVLGHVRFNVTGARTWKRLQPFAVFGAGVVIDLASDAAADAELEPDERFDFGTSFAGQLGAGIEWFPSSRVSGRVDAQAVFWKLPIPDAFRITTRGSGFPDSEWERNFVLSAGVSIHF